MLISRISYYLHAGQKDVHGLQVLMAAIDMLLKMSYFQKVLEMALLCTDISQKLRCFAFFWMMVFLIHGYVYYLFIRSTHYIMKQEHLGHSLITHLVNAHRYQASLDPRDRYELYKDRGLLCMAPYCMLCLKSI